MINNPAGNQPVPCVLSELPIGVALARSVRHVTVVDKDFHSFFVAKVSGCKLQKIREKSKETTVRNGCITCLVSIEFPAVYYGYSALSAKDISFNFRKGFRADSLFQLALPDGNNFPAGGSERSFVLQVTRLVHPFLFKPEIRVGFGNDEIFTAIVAVPETAVNKTTVLGQNDVGLSWKILDVEPVPETAMPQELTHHVFRFCVFGPDMRHAVMPLLGHHYVRHITLTVPRVPGCVRG